MSATQPGRGTASAGVADRGRGVRALPFSPEMWRVGARLTGRWLTGRGYETTIRFDRGQRIVLQLDDWIPYQVFLTGMYAVEASATRFFHTLLRPGMVVVDVGANIGYYTLQAAVRIGPGGQVTRSSQSPRRTRASYRTSA